jgi:hypothetical protein
MCVCMKGVYSGESNKIQRVYNAINYIIHFHLPIRVTNNWCSHDAILASIGKQIVRSNCVSL